MLCFHDPPSPWPIRPTSDNSVGMTSVWPSMLQSVDWWRHNYYSYFLTPLSVTAPVYYTFCQGQTFCLFDPTEQDANYEKYDKITHKSIRAAIQCTYKLKIHPTIMRIPHSQQLGHTLLLIIPYRPTVIIIGLYLINKNYPFPAYNVVAEQK